MKSYRSQLFVLLMLLVTLSSTFIVEAALSPNRADGASVGSTPSPFVDDRAMLEDPLVQDLLQEQAEYQKGGWPFTEAHFPRILLDSEEAKTVNERIDEMIIQQVELHLDAVKFNTPQAISAQYTVFQNDDFLSVLIEYTDWLMSPTGPHMEMAHFTFRLSDGSLVHDKELAEYYGVEDKLLGLMEQHIAKEYARLTMALPFVQRMNPDTYERIEAAVLAARKDCYEKLWENFGEEDYLFFNTLGDLCMRIDYYEPFQEREILDYAPINLTINREDKELNPHFVMMANEAKLDIADEDVQAFVVLVGAAFDGSSTMHMLEQLYPWQVHYNEGVFPQYHIPMRVSDYDGNTYVDGYEYYLLVPRYRHSLVTLSRLQFTEEGKLVREENQLSDPTYQGTLLVCQNISDIWPNGLITLRYREETIEFSPQVSMKDGSLMLPESVWDMEQLFAWRVEDSSAGVSYDESMYHYIMEWLN